jgi:hypothetical protein
MATQAGKWERFIWIKWLAHSEKSLYGSQSRLIKTTLINNIAK